MENLETLYARLFRPLALQVGVCAYVAFTWILWQDGFLPTAADAYFQLILIWALGLSALLIVPQRFAALPYSLTVLVRALWCNLGVVGLAVLVPHSLRVLLLVVPVFGLFYTALHANRSYVLLVAGSTWVFYLACTVLLAGYAPLDFEFELMAAVAFTLMISGSLLLGWEALRRQDELLEKSDHLAVAMSQVQELALQDELTGVHNRRHLINVLARQKALADRGEQGFTLCYCDLDYFKRLNDEFGHAVGDIALRKFAQLAAGVVRSIDYVARFGGEEFVLVLVGADEAEAMHVAERLAARMRRLKIPRTPENFRLTVSIGVTAYRAQEQIDDVLNRADKALYAAKDAGRDRVMLA